MVRVLMLLIVVFAGLAPAQAAEVPRRWLSEWPKTNFDKTIIDFSDVLSGGPPKDGIPSIDDPRFEAISTIKNLGENEPVIVLKVGGETKVYPLSVLIWHEIVNDFIAGMPVTVTYCPLCNAAIVFEARLNGQKLTFGTTGKLRHSDLIMYDRQSESWWQQFSGQGIVGEMTGQELKMLPARIESFGLVAQNSPQAMVLVPNNPDERRYGDNPYQGYDTSQRPFLFQGDLPDDINPMMRVVVVDDQAWTLALLRKRGKIEKGDLVLQWSAGQNSALDTRKISKGRDVGNVVVRRRTATGLVDVVHHITFAFVFHAFKPEGKLIQ